MMLTHDTYIGIQESNINHNVKKEIQLHGPTLIVLLGWQNTIFKGELFLKVPLLNGHFNKRRGFECVREAKEQYNQQARDVYTLFRINNYSTSAQRIDSSIGNRGREIPQGGTGQKLILAKDLLQTTAVTLKLAYYQYTEETQETEE